MIIFGWLQRTLPARRFSTQLYVKLLPSGFTCSMNWLIASQWPDFAGRLVWPAEATLSCDGQG
jgi:hypothetical protein